MAQNPIIPPSTLSVPSFTGRVVQHVIAEPLGGSQDIFSHLENFSDDVYRKSPETHFYKFMLTLFGPCGIGSISQELYQAREQIEEMGLDVTDLDAFFSNPFSFVRSAIEAYTPPNNPIVLQTEQQMRSSDSSYFSRAVNYIAGARAGNTPLGIQKVSEGGLGYKALVIENYKYLFDQHSDIPLGLPYFGQTLSTEEFIILPLPEASNIQSIEISITGAPTGGTIGFSYGRTNQPLILPDVNQVWNTANILATIDYLATRDDVRLALESIPQIGPGNVYVSGEPGGPWYINFQGELDINSIQLLNIYNNLEGPNVTIYIQYLYGLIEANEVSINIPSQDAYTLFSALDNIRPVKSIPTLYPNSSIWKRTLWNSVTATTEFNEVNKFITGNSAITWPDYPSKFWIRGSQEIQAPRIYKDIKYAYQSFHDITTITASSENVEPINSNPALGPITQTFTAKQALANYPDPLWVTSSDLNNSGIDAYIQGIYPIEYIDLAGAPPLNYSDHFWISQPGTDAEWLIIDFGDSEATNYLTFDIVYNPIQIDVFYDTFDDNMNMNFIQVTPIYPYSNVLTEMITSVPTATVELAFSNSLSQIIFTRRIKIQFSRLNGFSGNIAVQNLRIGRNIT